MALNNLFQILCEVFIQGDGRTVRFGQSDALRQQPAWTWRGLDDCNGTLVPFNDHLRALFDAVQDTGDIADRFHRAEMNNFAFHVFDHTSLGPRLPTSPAARAYRARTSPDASPLEVVAERKVARHLKRMSGGGACSRRCRDRCAYRPRARTFAKKRPRE